MRPFRIALTASLCCFAGQAAGLIALPFYLQLGLGHGTTGTGMVLACWPLAVAITGPFANRLAQRFGSASLCAAGGMTLGAGLLVLALWPAGASLAPLALGATLSGLGFGLFQVPNNRTMFLSAPHERSGAAGGAQGSARLIGQTLGAVLIGMLLASAPPAAAARAGLELSAFFAIMAGLVSASEVAAFSRRVRARTLAQQGRES
jgi:DHA2 family multidrug resistance protein-like MFS transporter